jgi:phosphatidylglycerophosphatase A
MISTQKSWWVYTATLGPIGYMTMPGTMASLAALPCMYCLHAYLPAPYYLAAIIALLCVSVKIIMHALDYFKDTRDPSQIVLDEVVGCLFTLYSVPLCWQTMLAGFLFFRFFDITKCCGIHYAERLAGAWGIILDDVIAGILTQVIIRCSLYIITGRL